MRLPYAKPYVGARRLTISLDIGTTCSGISYVLLQPGSMPEVAGVTRFPGQEFVNGGFKIPSVIYYDQDGEVKAIGAETLNEAIIERARSNNWFKSFWFKLHLKKPSLNDGTVLPPLPPNKTVVGVFADFISFLVFTAKSFLCEVFPGGKDLLQTVECEYVLSHPNGWEGQEQQLLKEAAVQAALITEVDDPRIHFVTEGEASLHFCLPDLSNVQVGKTTLIIDCGGGTVDLSAYDRLSSDSVFTESSVPECHYAGSVFVTRNADKYIKAKLTGTDFEEEIKPIVKTFDEKTKLGFASPGEAHYIRFSGRSRDTDDSLDITGGQLKLSGIDIAEFFETSIQTISSAIVRHIRIHGAKLSTILLVGGYAASPYLFSRLRSMFAGDIEVVRPNQNTSKAVADGSLLYYLECVVSTRISRHVYGAECVRDYDPKDPEHRSRKDHLQLSDSTRKKELYEGFDVIVEKGVRVSKETEYRRPYFRERRDQFELATVDSEIICYRGVGPTPNWLDADREHFEVLCTISADTSKAANALVRKRVGRNLYYRLDYEVILLMGLTELKAQIAWRERGREVRSPAKIVYHTAASA